MKARRVLSQYLLVVASAGVLALTTSCDAFFVEARFRSVPHCAGWNTWEFFRWATPARVRGCLAVGADAKARNRFGLTPLHHASAVTDYPAVIRALVVAGSWVDARTGDGRTPLHLAARSTENPAVIEALLAAGANAAARDIKGLTPWDYAQDNEALRGTDTYWRLHDGRFR